MEDRLSSYADLPALEAEQTKIIKLVDDTITHIQTKQKELGNIQLTLLDANSAKQSTEAISKGKKAVDDLTLSVREYKRLQDQLATTEAKLAVAQTETAKALAATKVELQATNKLNKEGASAYNDLQKELAAASRLYKDLAASRGLDNKATLEAQKRAKDLNDQLKAIDTGMGNYQRNVGNYSSATANLNRNIGILATELPNAGISLRTFAQSLSNNITPFIASIKEVQASNKVLQAEGKATTSVMKFLGQSLLSINVITGVAIAVGLKLVEYFEKSSKAAKEAASAEGQLAKAKEQEMDAARKQAAQEEVSAEILYKTAIDTTQAYELRRQSVEKLQKQYPSYFGNLSQEAILAGQATKEYQELNKALIIKASITARESELEDKAASINKAQDKLIAEENRLASLKADRDAILNTSAKTQLDLQKRIKAESEANLQISKQQQEVDARSGYLKVMESDREDTVNKILQDRLKITKLLLDENTSSGGGTSKRNAAAKKEVEDMAKIILDQMNNLALNEEQITAKSLDRLLTSFENQEIGIQEYAARKEQIVAESEDRILNYQIAALKDYLAAEGLQKDEIAKIEEKITDLTIKENEKRNKAREAQAKATASNLSGFQKAMYKDAADEAKKQAELEKQLARDIAKYKRDLEQELVRLVETAIMASYEKRVRAAEDEGIKIKENGEKEIEEINNSTLSQIEKDRRLDESKAVTAAKEKENERKINAIKNQAAKTERAITVAKIVAQTALNEVQALSYLTNPVTAPLYPALAALIAGLGAAQIATVLATPLPKYAEGTTNHKGGLAILGDGKEKELVIEPNKKPYWSADTDTIYNLPKHTQVIPESKLGSAITQPSNKDVVMAVMEMSGLIDGGLNKLNKTIRNKETVRLEAKNRRWQDYYYENAKA